MPAMMTVMMTMKRARKSYHKAHSKLTPTAFDTEGNPTKHERTFTGKGFRAWAREQYTPNPNNSAKLQRVLTK